MNLEFAAHFLKYARSLEPAGSCSTFLEHPHPDYRQTLAVPIGIVMEHRFAFAHWIKCKQSLIDKCRGRDDDTFDPPDLISFDWHDDFGCDQDFEKSDLERLNQRDDTEVALFCWAALRSLNDGHIRPAVWLNALGNVYIVQKQHDENDESQLVVKDRFEKQHQVYYVATLEELPYIFAETTSQSGVIWDVDLDYFTEADEVDDQRYTPMLSKKEIRASVSPRRRWVQQILGDLRAITIALEPEYTGGLTNSLELYRLWETSFFESPVFSKECRWKANLFGS